MDVERLKNATFRKADGSGDVGCVEVAFVPGLAGVRDSKHPDTSPVLPFEASEWAGFIARIKRGELG